MPFEEAVEVVSSNLVTRVLVPTWARRLTAGLRRVDDACDDVTVYNTRTGFKRPLNICHSERRRN